MDTEAKIILDDTISFCERDGRDARLIQILKQSRPLELTDTSLSIEAPTRFAYAYLIKQRDIVERYLEDIAFIPLTLSITVPASITAPTETEPQRPTERAASDHAPAGATHATATAHEPAAEPAPSPASIPIPAPSWDGAPAGGEERVKVTNIISPDELQRLTASVGGHEVPRKVKAEPVRKETAASGPAVPINSKFTFDNFVYGDENKHAYQSAVRFALLADEPGIYTSLFIYGKSGLGKTHLLLAIENYLSEHSPGIRVKYANSQTYVEDYINELRVQKANGGRILREYHDADVLIIDDIQNIIGKTQSIENFFSLMDEFIRNNKKIAIASDRAPKNLGMDERLTSRFNAGMLCLVSEPGFEMKYEILKRYYEHTVLPDAEARDAAAGLDASGSILSALRTGGGTLTDEQLKHMAEVSGTNIRELESFCERCAGASYECEQKGETLEAEEIDRIADEYFDRAHKRIQISTVQAVVEEFYHVSHEDLCGQKRRKDITQARHIAIYLAYDMCDMTNVAIGAEFDGRDHSTVHYSIKKIEKQLAHDNALCKELQALRNKIILAS